MIYKNVEIHNVAELIPHAKGGITWSRIPDNVRNNLATGIGKIVSVGSTGVEIRFVIKSGERAFLNLELITEYSTRASMQVYYGGIQGDSGECETLNCAEPGIYQFEIRKPSKLDILKKISDDYGIDWDPEVIRVIFDRGRFRFIGVDGDVEPPRKEQLPKKTLLTYGSSITHGSVAIDAPHTWASYLAHNLNMDLRNLGMAGSCAMEEEYAEYIAREGEKGNWDIATLELGINVLEWDVCKIREKAGKIIKQVATRNTDKKIFVISPFYCEDDYLKNGNAQKWRDEVSKILSEPDYPNVVYIDGSEVIENMSYLASDGTHPNIYGVQRIADKLTDIIEKNI